MKFITDFKFDDLPKWREKEAIKTIKGKEVAYVDTIYTQFLAASKCGKVLITHVARDGRLVGFANGEMPVGWCPLPKHPSEEDQGDG